MSQISIGLTEAQITDCVNDILTLCPDIAERDIPIIRKRIEKGDISRQSIKQALYDAKWKKENPHGIVNNYCHDHLLGMKISIILDAAHEREKQQNR